MSVVPFAKQQAVNDHINTVYAVHRGDVDLAPLDRRVFGDKFKAQRYAIEWVKKHAVEIGMRLVEERYPDETPFGGKAA